MKMEMQTLSSNGDNLKTNVDNVNSNVNILNSIQNTMNTNIGAMSGKMDDYFQKMMQMMSLGGVRRQTLPCPPQRPIQLLE